MRKAWIVETALIAATCGTCGLFACERRESKPMATNAGEPAKSGTTVLSQGAAALQNLDPVRQIEVYLDGFHTMKSQPSHITEAHHFCATKNEDLMQCVIFDGNTRDANLTGVEYIISERLFETLPDDEKKLWHPHNYEILSGQLVAPGLPSAAEKALLKKKVNSYGKTWHLWNTHGARPGAQGDALPIGEPMLAWSFNADGQIPEPLVDERDKRLGVNTAAKRQERADLAEAARPQAGVDALRASFPGSGGAPAGVTLKGP